VAGDQLRGLLSPVTPPYQEGPALVDPASPIGTPALLGASSFAYLTFRATEIGDDDYEFGAYAHGPQSEQLAATICDHITTWDRDHRTGPPAQISIHPASTPTADLPAGRVIPKRHSTVVITWP
jgi:protein-L-isoaspartate(D-aspartate) O-methyltransferase